MNNNTLGTAVLRKNLMKLSKSELIKECKKYNVSYGTTKRKMVDRIIKKKESYKITKHNKNKNKNTHKAPISVKTYNYNPTKNKATSNWNSKNIKTKKKIHKDIDWGSNFPVAKKEKVWTPTWIEWSDLEVLRNINGNWCMGETDSIFEFLKIEFKMLYDGNNRNWRAVWTKGVKQIHGFYKPQITYMFGCGHWKLIYPTSINVRTNIHHICNYYIRFYKIFIMILSRDVINIICDYLLGIGVRSLDLIDLKLILNKDSFKIVKSLPVLNDNTDNSDNDNDNVKQIDTKEKDMYWYGHDIGDDFTENFGFPVQNALTDLLLFCINEVENKDINNLNDYDNLMKLDEFTDDDDEKDEHFKKYFHHDN